jgi:hypothetical protein
MKVHPFIDGRNLFFYPFFKDRQGCERSDMFVEKDGQRRLAQLSFDKLVSET